ncbi:MAG: hypothetical protein Q9178_006119 [Gyalolechia marmorata]
MASDCKSEVCATHNTFGREDSASLETTQDEFNLTYGTGAVSGLIATDNVKLAGFSVSLPFGLANTTSEDFMSYAFDGILGLGPPEAKSTDYPTFMERIQETKALSSKLFGVNLQRSSDGATDGELSFEAPDTTKYQGDLSYTSLVKGASMWEIPLDEVKVNGDPFASTGKTAIIDTGTSFMLLPPADAEELHSRIPGAQEDSESYNIPCSSKTPIQLKFSNVLYNISPADYVGSPIKDGSSFAKKASDSSPTSTSRTTTSSPTPSLSSSGRKADRSRATTSAEAAVNTASAATTSQSNPASGQESVQTSIAFPFRMQLGVGFAILPCWVAWIILS